MLNLMTPRLDSENIDFDQLASPSATPRSESNKFQSSFPAKLYLLLESASEDIVSWLEDGKSFRVYDMERFVTSILPQYFKGTCCPNCLLFPLLYIWFISFEV